MKFKHFKMLVLLLAAVLMILPARQAFEAIKMDLWVELF